MIGISLDQSKEKAKGIIGLENKVAFSIIAFLI